MSLQNARAQGVDSVRSWILDQLSPILGAKAEAIDTQVPFLALGLDSVAAVGLTADLETYLGRALPPTVIADYPTIDSLAEYLCSDECLAGGSTVTIDGSQSGDSVGAMADRDWLKALNKRHDDLVATGNMFYEPIVTELSGPWATVDGRRMLLLGSYSYLGLNGHPRITDAAEQASREFGTGLHGARLLGGTTVHHRELELSIARLKGKQDAIVFSTGYMTNIMSIVALMGEGDCVIGDQLNHACLVDGCHFSKARFLTFPHNSMQGLEQRLASAGTGKKLIVVDAVFSMDGDIAPLPEIVSLAHQYDAMVMVDEAHSIGVLGKTGRGITEHFGLPADAVDLHMGTLSKSFPSMGGYIAASRELVSALKYNARGWIFSSAMPASLAASARAAIDVMLSEPQHLARLQKVLTQYAEGLIAASFKIEMPQTPIVPLLCRNEDQAFAMARELRNEGVMAYPIVYPAVPVHMPRVRTTVNAAMSDDDVRFAVSALARVGHRVGLLS